MSLPEVWKTEREVERLTNIDQSIVSFVNRVLRDICFTEKHIARVLIHFEKQKPRAYTESKENF